MDLIAVADTAMIFAPGRFLGISDEIDPRDMMMMPQTLLEKKKSARLASVALANKLARIIWAMMTSGEAFRKDNIRIGVRHRLRNRNSQE